MDYNQPNQHDVKFYDPSGESYYQFLRARQKALAGSSPSASPSQNKSKSAASSDPSNLSFSEFRAAHSLAKSISSSSDSLTSEEIANSASPSLATENPADSFNPSIYINNTSKQQLMGEKSAAKVPAYGERFRDLFNLPSVPGSPIKPHLGQDINTRLSNTLGVLSLNPVPIAINYLHNKGLYNQMVAAKKAVEKGRIHGAIAGGAVGGAAGLGLGATIAGRRTASKDKR